MTTNGKPPSHTDRVRELARYIADQPDEATNPTIVNVHVDATGKHAAMPQGNDEITQTDHGVPKQESEPPKAAGVAVAVVSVIRAVNNPYALGALALLVAALFIWLRFR